MYRRPDEGETIEWTVVGDWGELTLAMTKEEAHDLGVFLQRVAD